MTIGNSWKPEGVDIFKEYGAARVSVMPSTPHDGMISPNDCSCQRRLSVPAGPMHLMPKSRFAPGQAARLAEMGQEDSTAIYLKRRSQLHFSG